MTNHTTYYLKHSQSVVSLVSTSKKEVKPTDTQYKDAESGTAVYQPWGENDDWPVIARQKMESSTTAYSLIAQRVGLMFGKGVHYYRVVKSVDGISYDFSEIPEVEDFLESSRINFLMAERLMDFKNNGNINCEFIMNAANNKVNRLGHLDSEFCRFKTNTEKNGDKQITKITHIGYCSDWSEKNNVADIPYVDPKIYHDKTAILKIANTSKKFAIHSALPSPGRTLYAFPPHGALFKKGGWLDYANGIPELMNAINENGMILKYHIQIPETHWPKKYKDWSTISQIEQLKLMEKEFDAMDEFLKGKDNAGSIFISHFAVDKVTGKAEDGWKIVALDDKLKKDQFLTSVQEADTQIARAVQMDSSMSNLQPQGGKMGAGSGSDKRVGFENMINTSYLEQMIVLEPLELVKKINEWPRNLQFFFLHDIPTSLNENKKGVKSEISES